MFRFKLPFLCLAVSSFFFFGFSSPLHAQNNACQGRFVSSSTSQTVSFDVKAKNVSTGASKHYKSYTLSYGTTLYFGEKYRGYQNGIPDVPVKVCVSSVSPPDGNVNKMSPCRTLTSVCKDDSVFIIQFNVVGTAVTITEN